MLNNNQKERIVNALSTKIKYFECPMCHSHSFTIADGYIVQGLQNNIKTIILGNMIPSIAIVCNNCGFMSQHNLGVLGLLDKNDKSTDGETQDIENTVHKFASKFVDNINISFSRKLTNEELEKLADICCDSFFENKKYINIEGVVEYIDSYYEHLFSNILEALGKNLISAMSSNENIKEIYKYYIEHIYPLYEENKAIKNRTKEVFKEKLADKISKNYKSNNQ